MDTITIKVNHEDTSFIKSLLERLKGVNEIAVTEETPYSESFVNMVLQGEEDIKNGKFTVIKTADLWK